MKITGILFDMDGVIVDTETLHSEIDKKVLLKFGIKRTIEEEKCFVARPFIDSVTKLIKKKKIDLDPNIVLKEKRIELKKTLLEVKPFSDTINLIKNCYRKYKMCIVTTSPRKEAEMILKNCNLKKYFEFIIGFEDVKKHKPEPEPYLLALKKLGKNAEECIIIEDSVNGVKSGKSAGIYTVARIGTYEKDELNMADIVLEKVNFNNLKTILK